jgi:hypothetical protein
MADLTDGHPDQRGRWPNFGGRTVIGWELLDFADWVIASNNAISSGDNPGNIPIIAMPPMQRSAVWRPKQVLDFWNSLLRGLPIGTFYLASRAEGRCQVVVPGTNTTEELEAGGFDLLDGQQRLRALMAGVFGPVNDKRYLWIDLEGKFADQTPCLRLTSKVQPFGYDATTGGKLHLDERRKARQQIEPDPNEHPLQYDDGSGIKRRAYDLELFDGDITLDDKPLRHKPPLPFGTREGSVFALHALLSAWRKLPSDDMVKGVAALRSVTGDAPELEGPLIALHEGFCKVRKAEVALLNVCPDKFWDPKKDILDLFERIGAAGTPLSTEERLYSIYKHYEPKIRDTVEAIHQDAGHVLAPTKIVAAGLRIANALVNEQHNNTPDPAAFIKAMTENPESDLRRKLHQLLPVRRDITETGHGALKQSFQTVKLLLSYKTDVGSFWLPDVLLGTLPVEIWEVLLFWVTRHPEHIDQDSCRKEMVRFALFWRLCVWNDEKAAKAAFAYIKDPRSDKTTFPGAQLYRLFIGATGGEEYAHALLSPHEFARKLCIPAENANWRTDNERFIENGARNHIGSNWWWYGRKMLPWLQRDYIRKAFPDYTPLSEHEDDLPYDVDHICPYKEWGDDFRLVRKRFDDDVDAPLRDRMEKGRGGLGNGIGNLRLVDSSTNRFDQDDDISKKMPFLVAVGNPLDDDEAMSRSAFSLELCKLWSRVSRPGPVETRLWNSDRLAAFQHAVEHRGAWLYGCFHDELDFETWTSDDRLNNVKQ